MKFFNKNKKIKIFAVAFACLLLLLRFYLAFIVKGVVNDKLSKMSGYSGHIDGIVLSLWRGAYQIEGMRIDKKGGKEPLPFFSAPLMDIGLQWKALFQGRIVAKVKIAYGQLNFINGPGPEQGQSGKGEDWQQVLESLVPVKINHFELEDSEIHFRDPYGSPPVDVHLDELKLLAENLSSQHEGYKAALGSVSASARVMGNAHVAFHSRFNPFAKAPTFDYSATLLGLNFNALNPLLLRYAGIDVAEGVIDIYSEAAAAEGKFKGYVKPMVKGLRVMKPHEKSGLGKRVKKMLVGILGWIFKNDKDQVATKFEFAGEYKNPQTSLWKAALYLFENAFIKSLPPTLEGAVKVEELQKKSGK